MSARMRLRGLASAAALAGAALASSAQAASTITVVNGDGPNEGFNDPTPATPVGGNPGTTRGQQAFNVFQAAASAWGQVLNSNVEIRIRATFDPLECTAAGAVLGRAGPISVDSDPAFPNPDAWYVSALGNALRGQDADPANDDISAQFNSQLGQGPCAAFADWYYGLDGNPTNGANDLASTVLHEFGHGLGFLTLVNKTTGAQLGGQPDIWSFFLRDKTQNKLWVDMNNAERLASITNTGNLVWIGERTTLSVPTVLGPPGRFAVLSPAAIAGEKAFGAASFGPPLPAAGLTGEVALGADSGTTGSPSDACEPLAPLEGKIALVDRGVCGFVVKVKNAQLAGASAVLVADNDPANVPPPALGGSDDTVTIPAVRISKADGDAIKAALAGGSVSVRLDRDPSKLSGANEGQAQLYTPAVIAAGSSASHFTDVADPDLLMEPFSNRRNGLVGLDLTTPLFQDIGWSATTDVGVEVSGEYVEVDGGARAVFTIDVTNVADGSVEGVSLANATPAGLTFVSNEGACVTAFPCELGTLGVGASKRVVATFAIPAEYGETNVVDQAVVTSTTADLTAANNAASFTLDLPIGQAGSGGSGGNAGTGGAAGTGGEAGTGGVSGTGGSGTGGSGTGGTGGSGTAGTGGEAGTGGSGTAGTGGEAGTGGSSTGGTGGTATGGTGGAAGSGTAGDGTAGSGTAGDGSSGSGTAGGGTAGSGTAGGGTGGSSTQGSGGSGTQGSGGSGTAGTGGSGTSGSGTAGKGGSGTAGGGGKAGNPTTPGDDDDGGCSYSPAGAPERSRGAWLPALAVGLAFLRRRRSSPNRGTAGRS